VEDQNHEIFMTKFLPEFYLFLLYEQTPFSTSVYKASNGWRTNK